jgi:hypothetical protein
MIDLLPRWGEPWGVGDVYVTTEGGDVTFLGVADAADGAQRILDAKARLVSGSVQAPPRPGPTRGILSR